MLVTVTVAVTGVARTALPSVTLPRIAGPGAPVQAG